MLEVLAYTVDEAVEGTTTRIDVVAHPDGSVCVSDDGRGTDTRLDERGVVMVKPVMSTADLRFHGVTHGPLLADGLPRRGMSVVAALSAWVDHTHVRSDGGWMARYERGFPVATPRPIPVRGLSTGTSVRLWPDPDVFGGEALDLTALRAAVATVDSPATITTRRAESVRQGAQRL